jgi:hypothetical protein
VSGDQPVPLAGVCLGRTMPIEYVYALVRAGILPPPDGADELVPRGYLAAVDPDPLPELRAGEWRDHLMRELRRFRDGRTRLLDASSHGEGR